MKSSSSRLSFLAAPVPASVVAVVVVVGSVLLLGEALASLESLAGVLFSVCFSCFFDKNFSFFDWTVSHGDGSFSGTLKK